MHSVIRSGVGVESDGSRTSNRHFRGAATAEARSLARRPGQRRWIGWLSALALACAASTAPAQTMQRCEDAQGRVTYSNQPCPAGSSAVRKVEPPPPPVRVDQKAAADRAARDLEKARALDAAQQKDAAQREAKLERERVKADEQARKRAAECRKLDARVRSAEREWNAAVVGKPRDAAERKLRTATEAFEAECKGG